MMIMHEAINQPNRLPYEGTEEWYAMAKQAELDFQKELALQRETKATQALLANMLDDAASIGVGSHPFLILNDEAVDVNIYEAQHGDPARAHREQRQDRLRVELADPFDAKVTQHVVAGREAGTSKWGVQFLDYPHSPHATCFPDSAAPTWRRNPNAEGDKHTVFTPRDVAAGEQTSQDVQRVAAILRAVRTQIEQGHKQAAAA